MKKLIFIAMLLASFGVYAAAQMWCLNGTTTCSYGTPSLSKLNKAERAAIIHKMYIAKYIEAVHAGTFEAVTANQLIALAKEKLKEPEPEPEVCPEGQEGTPPNCTDIVPEPVACGEGFTGFEPNCTPVEPAPLTDADCAPLVASDDGKACETNEPPASGNGDIIQSGQMPAVDISKYMTPAVGSGELLVSNSNQTAKANVPDAAFRINCAPSHMSNDDPMVYPNQEAATHSHTFFGNTSVKYDSDLMTLSEVGNSTCHGGIMNRSGYWVPTVIDTATNTPIVPTNIQVYYKSHAYGNIIAPPKGLRMIAGSAKATKDNPQGTEWAVNHAFKCNGSGKGRFIPACSGVMSYELNFPECWDGDNLDSPNHQDHMAFASYYDGCPASHPKRIPKITFNVMYDASEKGTSTWRLASDNYSNGEGGYSIHGDWVNGWSESHLQEAIDNCINAGKDCHSHLIGDGRTFHSQ